jgi:hypothetical protein
MGNKKIWGHGRQTAVEFTKIVLDSPMFFEPSSQPKRPEVNVPDTISDFFESDLFVGAGDRDVDPGAIPAAPRKVK